MPEVSAPRGKTRPGGPAGRSSPRPRPPSRTLRAEHFTPVLLVVVGLVAYSNALRGPFVLDDIFAIPNNGTIRTLWPISGVLSPPAHSAVEGRPLVNLSLALNYAVSGLDVFSYHVFNLAVHLCSALVLFAIVLRTLRSHDLRTRYREQAPGIATTVALLWAVHPLASESVDYTIQRTELLMGFFFLLTLYFALRAFESPDRPAAYFAALAAFALGLGSKEIIVVAPAVVFAYDWLFWSPSVKDALRRHLRLYLGFAIVLVFFVLVVGTRLRRAFSGLGVHMSPVDYALTQSGVILHYLRLAVWPHPLAADYDGWPIARSVTSVLPWLVVVLALVALTIWALARRRKLAFLGVWFFLVLAPTSSFRPLTTEVVAERRMYLPLAAVVTLGVLAGHAFLRQMQVPGGGRVAAVAAVAAVLTFVTVRRNEDYRTTLSFWSDVVAKRPTNPRARIWLGQYLQEQGQVAEAVRQLAEAVRLRPGDAMAQYDLGVALASQGRTTDAIEHFREALRINPKYVPAHNSLGVVLQRRSEMGEAIEHYRAALRINPSYFNARYNLALALARQGDTHEAIEQLEAAIRLKPDSSEARRKLDDLRSRERR